MTKKKPSFIKLFLLTVVTFLVIILFLEFLIGLSNNASAKESFDHVFETKNIIKRIVVSIVYGIVLTWFIKKKEKHLKK